ncbi:MAG: glycosyltransferase family 4 protein [Actinomycetota bacterium]|nr:glycosyltransferase family 4 protein [Actinomycetota bacterium]
MRIAMVGQKSIPARYGGVERAVEEVAARLVEQGHDVTCFNWKEKGEEMPRYHRGIRLRYVPAVGGKHLRNMSQSVVATIATLVGDYDIVHYHALGPTLASPIARLRPTTKVVVTIQGRDDQRAKWSPPARAVLGLAAWVAAKVPHAGIAVSKQLQKEFLEEFGRRTVHIPNGVAAREAPASYTPEEMPEHFGLTSGRYLAMVGRLVPEKAADQLIRAYRNVPTDVQLAIIGGSSHTDEYVERLHSLAEADDRVILTGPVYGNGIDSLFRHAMGYVMPSLLEGLPLALLEGISYGLPVAVSDIPPHVEVVGADGPGHRVFRAGDIEHMTKQLTALVTDPEGENAAAQRQTARVLHEYSWEGITNRTRSVYEALLDDRDPTDEIAPLPAAPGTEAANQV